MHPPFPVKSGFGTTTNTSSLVSSFLSDFTKYGHNAINKINHFFLHVLKVSPGSDQKIVLVSDSLADLGAMIILANCALSTDNQVTLIYYRTNEHDDGLRARILLSPLEESFVKVVYFDHLVYGDNMSVDLLAQQQPSVLVTNLFDSYDLRNSINTYAEKHFLNVPEIPTIDLVALTSDAFTVDPDRMRAIGNLVRDTLSPMVSYHLLDQTDGTDIVITTGRMINEAANDFSIRPSDYQNNPQLPPPIQDNYPCGEVWANIHQANGTLVIYQVEPDMLRWALRNPNLTSFTPRQSQLHQLVYDPNDPIVLKVIDSYVTDIQGNYRAELFRDYLAEQSKIDSDKGRPSNSPYRLCELAWGINPGAKNPDELTSSGEHITSVLITEKTAGVPHIAIGNLPDRGDPDIELLESDTHLDHGLRNPRLQIFGTSKEGSTSLLTSVLEGEVGLIDKIINTGS